MDYSKLGIRKDIYELCSSCEEELKDVFAKYEENALLCSAKVLGCFHENYLSSSHFVETSGYGYSDSGRDKLEKIYASIFHAEDALVRPQIMSGTHALTIALFGLLKYGDTLLAISGDPYDSLQSIIGIKGDSKNSLISHGINYESIDLVDDDFDTDRIIDRIKSSKVKLVEIQRSRGYAHRSSITIEKIERVCKQIKLADKDVIIMVDNCYGDFVEEKEPTEVGCDVLVGSLMKNLGGGYARAGGYVVGKKELVWQISERFSAPMIGKDIGANFGQIESYFKGLYNAPNVVCACLKTATLLSMMLEKLGYEVSPLWDEKRADIVQTITFHDRDKMVAFCESYQKGTAVDAFVTPIVSSTPGYPHDEIMASGSFTTGSTLEFSCDGPVVEPYSVYAQGSLNYNYGKLGIMIALSDFLKKQGR